MPFLLCGCSDDDDECKIPQEKPQVEEARYYVKYELSAKAKWINQYTQFTVATDTGMKNYKLVGSDKWEATYGPVKKGFKTTLSSYMDDGSYQYSTNISARISVCRGKEPFTLKAEDSDPTSVSLEYTIDF